MTDGLIRVAAASLPVHLGCPAANAEELVGAARCAAEEGTAVLVTPELGLCGASLGDLFCQQTLLEEAQAALVQVVRQTAELPLLMTVGLPLRFMGKRYNCAAVVQGGQVLGIVPKTYLSGALGREEGRQFVSGEGTGGYIELPWLGKIPFGNKLLFRCSNLPLLSIGVEIGEDLWAPNPPSGALVAAGASLILCPGAQAEGAGRAAYRRSLVCSNTARLIAGYAYAGAGVGESTTDWVYAGHCLLAENGKLLGEATPFTDEMALADVDLELLQQERCRHSAFPAADAEEYRELSFALDLIPPQNLLRPLSPLPFVPKPEERDERCEMLLCLQAQGLRKRLEHTGAKTVLVGVSGGLDSTLALLVAKRALGLLGRAQSELLAVTMPGFGTSGRTKNNAQRLCNALGVPMKTIDITASVRSHFADIGQAEANHDVTYENAQARMRTLVLMDLANQCGGLVVGTGDLSELALGWATYNGDHMSMYGVNAAVPKTLLRALVAHEAALKPALAEVLKDVLNTPVSPELLPLDEGEISQQTEQIVGPYELHDFFLFYLLRYGFRPGKIYCYAQNAFAGRYTPADILHWMKIFYTRFFAQQFKRNCLPDGPALGSVGLSPRGGWQMPSDAQNDAWMDEIERLTDDNTCQPV